jgi:hypothetical protein
VFERGWWDIAVDPLRYGLNVPPRLVRALGRLLPRPDLALVLESSPHVLAARKNELSEQEILRQSAAWRDVLPRDIQRITLDASLPPERLAEDARRSILAALEARAVSRLGTGWSALPNASSFRWLVPRGPRRATMTALRIYQPITIRAQIAWRAARLVAATGAFRLTRRSDGPPRSIRTAVGPYLPPKSTLSLWRANHPDRFVALITNATGSPHAVAKIALDDAGRVKLAKEANALKTFAPMLQAPLAAPRILAQDKSVLVLEPVAWKARLRPWVLEVEVARGLGRFFRLTSKDGVSGPSHGDFAPWNLLRTDHGWALVDWEDASQSRPAMFDLFHFIVQAHALLGRPSQGALIAGAVHGGGWIGRAIQAYADSAGVPAEDAPELLRSYLRLTAVRFEKSEGRESAARIRLRRAMGC